MLYPTTKEIKYLIIFLQMWDHKTNELLQCVNS